MNQASKDTIKNVDKKLSTTDSYLYALEGDLGKLFESKGLNYHQIKSQKLVMP